MIRPARNERAASLARTGSSPEDGNGPAAGAQAGDQSGGEYRRPPTGAMIKSIGEIGRRQFLPERGIARDERADHQYALAT
jgi:hypothetical protein